MKEYAGNTNQTSLTNREDNLYRSGTVDREGGLHQIKLTNRERGYISGVVDVLSFDEHEILLDTTEGRISIRGKNLHVGRLQLEEGEVEMDGQVETVIYDVKKDKSKDVPLMKRLFG